MATEWVKRWFGTHQNLKNNRWEPAADELAVYFNTSELSGVLTKTLNVPSGCRARLLMDNTVEDINEGEKPVENLWQRINGVFGGRHGEVLITRNAALLVPFVFKDLLCGDLKRVAAEVGLRLEVGEVQRFRNHFMRQPGAVNVAQLQGLLSVAVRQVVVEFVHAYTLAELQADLAGLRNKLQARIDRDMGTVLNEHGLRLQGLESLGWTHEPTAEEKDAATFEQKRKEIWQRFGQGGLKADEAEYAAALRDRDLDLLERIRNADTREQAIKLGAAEAVENLETEYNRRKNQRDQQLLGDRYQVEEQRAEWGHIKALADIRRQSVEAATRAAREAEAKLAAERFENELEKFRIQAAIEQNELIADEAKRQAQLAIDMERMGKVWLREESLNQTQHQIQIDTLIFEDSLRKREQLRLQQWDDAEMAAEIAKLQVQTAENITQAKQSGLRGLIELDDLDERNKLSREQQARLDKIEAELALKKGNAQIEMDLANANLERDLKKAASDREEAKAQREHEIRKASVFGSMPPEAMAAMVSDPVQLETIARIFRIRTQAGMEAEQIRAMNNEAVSGGAGGHTPSSQQLEGAVGQAVSREVQQLLERWRQDESRQWDRFDRMHGEDMRAVVDMGEKIKATAIEMAKALSVQAVPSANPIPQYAANGPAGNGFQVPPVQSAATPSSGQTINQTVQQGAPSLVGMRICSCGVINASHAEFCQKCGKSFQV